MDKQVKRILILVFGWVFIIFGVVGLFLPFLQGILFLLIGFYMLSHESQWAKKQFDRLKKRYPGLYHRFAEIKNRFADKYREIFHRKI